MTSLRLVALQVLVGPGMEMTSLRLVALQVIDNLKQGNSNQICS